MLNLEVLENGEILMQIKFKKISSDASFREFYRVQKNSTSTILVRSNKNKFKNLIVYAAVNKLLIDNKVKAPKKKSVSGGASKTTLTKKKSTASTKAKSKKAQKTK